MRRQHLTRRQYERLFVFRTAMRHYLHWSAEQTRAAGLTPQQHQLLLAVRAHPGRTGPKIGDIATSLVLKHHSAVELVDRAQALHLVRRTSDRRDRRIVRIRLTRKGGRLVDQLTEAHLEELRRIVPAFETIQRELVGDVPIDVPIDIPAREARPEHEIPS